MILKASQRGGAVQMGLHLMRTDENDHAELWEVRGFASHTVVEAFREAQAISKGTKCKQFLFSLSLSPPETAAVTPADFVRAIDAIEDKLGLFAQPRVIVFHEKNGRRHAHCVWSRIDAESMTAVHLPHFKRKLQDMSRQLFIEHGWKMPNGFITGQTADPLNYSQEEYWQAKRMGQDPKAIKALFQDCWAISDSRRAFRSALAARGLYLARGDRRAFVAVDWQGEIYSVSRWVGRKVNEIAARLGDPADLPSAAEVKQRIGAAMADRLHQFAGEMAVDLAPERARLVQERLRLVQQHRSERALQKDGIAKRWAVEASERARRLPTGLRALWDRLTGRYSTTVRRNEMEAVLALDRDLKERQVLIDAQLVERRQLELEIRNLKHREVRTLHRLGREASQYLRWKVPDLLSPASIERDEPSPRKERLLRL